jgi:EAL domain-containing protein (putative c-di-GMP-specific phosphodiesterase class I)
MPWPPAKAAWSRTASVLDHLSLRGDLQRALREGGFRPQYQPLIRLADGTPAGVEALIRWPSPARGFVSPVDFIGIAEEFGLIVDIGQWVRETSVTQVAQWRRTFPDLGLNVNVSGHQLVHPRCSCRSTISAPAIRRSPACVNCGSTS